MRHIHTPAVSKKLTFVQLSPASRLRQAAEPDFPPRLCLPRRGIPGCEAEQSWGDPRRQESIQGKERIKETYSVAKRVLQRSPSSPSRGTLPKGPTVQVLPSPKEAWFSPGAAPCLVSEAPTLSGAGGCWAAGKLQGRTQQAKPPSADPPSCVFHARPQLGCS